MEIGATLAAELDLLTDALNDPSVDIAETLRAMADATRSAVPSFLGLSLVALGAGAPVTFTAMEAGTIEVRTSLMLPLLRPSGLEPRRAVSLIIYAGRAGALVDLAADMTWLTGLDGFELDGHLSLPAQQGTHGALQAESIVNQALGLLIGLGYLPDEADRELGRRSTAEGTTRSASAEQILEAGGRPP